MKAMGPLILMESELKTEDPAEEVDVSVFADDVKIRSRSARGLQRRLNVCTKWTDEENMSWSPPKCHVLEPTRVEGEEIPADYST